MSTVTPTRSAARRPHRVAVPLLPPALAFVALTVAALVLPQVVAGEGPWTSDHALLDFFAHHTGAARLSALLTLGASVPFAVFAAAATSRLRTLGLDVPGRIIAQTGGAIAAAMLALAGLASFALVWDGPPAGDAVTRSFYGLTFAAGGPGFVVFTGLLLAGVSIPGLVGRVMPRWLGWFGLAIAAASELAILTIATDSLDFLLPIGRFGTAAWMLGVASLLPARRRRDTGRAGAPPQLLHETAGRRDSALTP